MVFGNKDPSLCTAFPCLRLFPPRSHFKGPWFVGHCPVQGALLTEQMALLNIVFWVSVSVVEASGPPESLAGQCCPWHQAFRQLSRTDVSKHCRVCLSCPASLQRHSLKLQKTREHRGDPLPRCMARATMVARPIQILMMDVSCFEVENVGIQESTLKRTQLHLFPSREQGLRYPSCLSVPRACI